MDLDSDNGLLEQSSGQGFGPPRRSRFRILPIVLFAIFGLIYYFSNQQTVPITGRKQFVDMDRETETALGVQAYREVLSTEEIIPSGPEVELVRDVGRRIAAVTEDPGFEWEFNLIRSDDANAFCLPGGKVVVYTGILPVAKSADGLAAIIGHEVAHAIARHGAERMAQSKLAEIGQMAVQMSVSDMDNQTRQSVMTAFGLGAQYGVLLPFSRKHESEADYIGLMYMARACFHPEEAEELWKRMAEFSTSGQPPQFASTHPSHERRIEQFREWLPAALEERARYCGG